MSPIAIVRFARKQPKFLATARVSQSVRKAKPKPVDTDPIVTMEHRWSPRRKCDFPIKVRARNSLNLECRVTNANHSGFCIDTGSVDLIPGSVLELVLEGKSLNAPGQTILAMVIHADHGHAGLWLGDDPEQQAKLLEMIEHGTN